MTALNETHLPTIRTMLRSDTTISEIAESFGVSRDAVFNFMRRFELPRVKRGRKIGRMAL